MRARAGRCLEFEAKEKRKEKKREELLHVPRGTTTVPCGRYTSPSVPRVPQERREESLEFRGQGVPHMGT